MFLCFKLLTTRPRLTIFSIAKSYGIKKEELLEKINHQVKYRKMAQPTSIKVSSTATDNDILQELNNMIIIIIALARQKTIKDCIQNDHNVMIQKWSEGEIITHTCKVNNLDHVKSVPSLPHVKHPFTIVR